MIKRVYQKVTAYFRQLPLTWKTWIITSITLVATLLIFFMVFSLFATSFVKNTQQRKFDKNVNNILTTIQTKGLSEKELNQYMIEGFTVMVYAGEELIFPSYFSVSPVFESNAALFSSEEALETVEPVIEMGYVNENSLTTQELIYYQGQLLRVDIFYPVLVNSDEIKSVLVTVLPYFIVIGMVVSLIVSWLYARYFTSKINHLNKLVHQMATSSISSSYDPQKGDELQELKNNVFYMYQELQLTLSQLNQEMERVRRLESDRQVFMRGATHELKTPIMGMMTSLRGMMEGVEGYEDSAYHLAQCYSRLQSMSRLVNEMLEVSRLDALIFSGETNLVEGTATTLALYDYMILDKKIDLKIVETADVNVTIPPRALQKVLSNLIGNAVKYSPADSELQIINDGQCWEIRNQVKDLQKINVDKLFEPFISYAQDDDEVEKSHGLGLYIVTEILKQYEYTYDWELLEVEKEFVFRIHLNKENQQRLLT